MLVSPWRILAFICNAKGSLVASVFINPLCVFQWPFSTATGVFDGKVLSRSDHLNHGRSSALCAAAAVHYGPESPCSSVVTLSRGAVFSGWNTAAHVDSGHFTGIGRWPVCDTRVCVYCHVKTCRLLWVKHVCYTAAAKLVSITNSRETKLKKVIKAGESEAMCAWEILMCTVKLL